MTPFLIESSTSLDGQARTQGGFGRTLFMCYENSENLYCIMLLTHAQAHKWGCIVGAVF